jgi:hypothetical protein
MTETEQQEFLEKTYKIFPSLIAFTKEFPSIVETWLETLAGDQMNREVLFSEAMGVLDRWKFGTLANPPTAPWQRELFATHIRAVVEQDRLVASRFNYLASERQELKAKIERRKAGYPAARLMAPIFEKCLEINRQVMNGLMTQHDADWAVCKEITKADEAKP